MSRIKLVVPSNLLYQENVCFIPREAEHPSKIHMKLESQQYILFHLYICNNGGLVTRLRAIQKIPKISKNNDTSHQKSCWQGKRGGVQI